MHNVSSPPPTELPSSGVLARSTLFAAIAAVLILVVVVLPAEYGFDVTGVGRVLGLTEMGEVKMALAREAAAEEAAAAAAPDEVITLPLESSATDQAAPGAPYNTHFTELTLDPGQGKEIKLLMREGGRANYQWSVAGGVVNYDTHGDPIPTPRNFYHGYGKGAAVPGDQGTLVAAFDGLHGWFWRNRGAAPVTVTLRTEGAYEELREIK